MNFPTKNAFQESKASVSTGKDAFVAKLSFPDDLTLSLVYSSYLGGEVQTIMRME